MDTSSDGGSVQLSAHAEDLLVHLVRASLVAYVGSQQALHRRQTRQVVVRRAQRLAQLVRALQAHMQMQRVHAAAVQSESLPHVLHTMYSKVLVRVHPSSIRSTNLDHVLRLWQLRAGVPLVDADDWPREALVRAQVRVIHRALRE